MQPLPPAGWYPDPNGSSHQRWWNGQSWTEDLAPVAAAVGAPSAAPFASYAPQAYSGYPAGSQPYRPVAQATGGQRNRFALITFGIVALYMVIAVASHVVLLGILPIMMSVRSMQAREPLAPLAVAAAVIAIVVAIATLA